MPELEHREELFTPKSLLRRSIRGTNVVQLHQLEWLAWSLIELKKAEKAMVLDLEHGEPIVRSTAAGRLVQIINCRASLFAEKRGKAKSIQSAYTPGQILDAEPQNSAPADCSVDAPQ